MGGPLDDEMPLLSVRCPRPDHGPPSHGAAPRVHLYLDLHPGSASPQTSIVAAGRTSPKQRRRAGQQGSKSARSGSR